LECQWKRTRNFEWPFEASNVDYCLEELRLECIKYLFAGKKLLTKKYSLLIFTTSALPYHRKIHNHSFMTTLKQKSYTSTISWTCNQVESVQQICDSLAKLKSIKKLNMHTWTGTLLDDVC
jgi:hypothetical protein